MQDPHEKTHGGFGPTRKEWDEEIIPRAEESAFKQADEFVRGVDRVVLAQSDAAKVYSYTGKDYRFMRFAVRAIWGFIARNVELQAKAVTYRDQRLKALESRVEALDGVAVTKSLDMEAYDAMGDIASRLERIEGELQEQASGKIHYRGYWRSGEVAQEGDCYSHNGSTYRANCQTETEPGTAGGDWSTLARGTKYEREKHR